LSTDRASTTRIWIYGAGLVLLAHGAVGAAEVDFRPSLSFGAFYNGNLAVTGEGPGDYGANLALDLRVERRTATSLFSFDYRPAYEAYQESKDLDYFSNTIAMGYSREGARASKFYFNVYGTRTDYQGATPLNPDAATTFLPRTTLTRGDARIGGNIAAGKRGFVDLQLRGAVELYDDLDDNPATPNVAGDPVDFVDTTAGAASIAWRTEVSPRNTIGVTVDGSYFDYENEVTRVELIDVPPGYFILPPGHPENVLVETLGVVGTSQPGEYWQLSYLVGWSRAESGDFNVSGFSFDLTAEYTALRETTFSGGARQVFSPGTGVPTGTADGVGISTTTQDRGIWVSYAHSPSARGLSGAVVGGFWQREVVNFEESSTGAASNSINVTGNVGWKFNRFITLSANAAFVDQSTKQSSSLETNYLSYGFFLNWAIRGR
jgi:hypothetical protein